MAYSSLLNQTCTYTPHTGADAYGSLTFGASQTIKCRFSNDGLKLSNFAQGQISQTAAMLWILPTLTPKVNDKAVVNGVTYQVKSVNSWINGNGSTLGYKLTIEEYA